MSLLEIALLVMALAVLLTFVWGLTQPEPPQRRTRRARDGFRRTREEERDPL
jgi:hypothetical protein